MDINFLQTKIAELEICLFAAMTEELRTFKAETGLSPSDINLEFRHIQSVEQKTPDRILTGVRVTINISS